MRDTSLKRQGPAFWQVTFGDLLTLMLCFFLAVISLGPLGNGGKNHRLKPVNLRTGRSASGLENSVRGGATGIVLASRFNDATALAPLGRRSGRERWLSFPERAYAELQSELGAEAKHRLAKALRVRGYEVKGATVETCCSLVSVDEAQCWELSAKRGVSLHGDLVRLGLKTTAVRLRVLGTHCNAMRGRQRKALASRVGFEMKRANNG